MTWPRGLLGRTACAVEPACALKLEPCMWARLCELAPAMRKRRAGTVVPWSLPQLHTCTYVGSHTWTSGGGSTERRWWRSLVKCFGVINYHLDLIRRENIYSSNGYIYDHEYPIHPFLRKPVSYEPALDVASACHRDEEGSHFYFVCILSQNKIVERKRKKKPSPKRYFVRKSPKGIYILRAMLFGVSIAQSLW